MTNIRKPEAALSPSTFPLRFLERVRMTTFKPGLVLAWLVILLALAWAIAPSLFTGHNPLQGDPAQKLQGPSWEHWMGTDIFGRDLFARVVYGSVNSVTGAALAVGLGLTVGTFFGVVAGSSVRAVDDLIMRLVDVLLAIPNILLSLTFIILFGPGNISVAVAVGVSSIAIFARLARSEVVRVRRSDYVEAAFGSGGSFRSVLWRHVLPNSMTSVVALSALQFGSAILAIAALGFLGYGAPPPTPEWGLLIAEGRNFVAVAWWLSTLPGVIVLALVLATNRVSQSIRGEE